MILSTRRSTKPSKKLSVSRLVRRHARRALGAIVCLVLFVGTSGCWTQRAFSWPHGSVSVLSPMQTGQSITIRAFDVASGPTLREEDADTGALFAETLRDQLVARQVFSDVEVVGKDAQGSSGLVLEGSVEVIGRQGLWRFACFRTYVQVSGRLIDPANNTELMRFSRTRAARGVVSEGALVRDLIEWVAEDVAIFVDDLAHTSATGEATASFGPVSPKSPSPEIAFPFEPVGLEEAQP